MLQTICCFFNIIYLSFFLVYRKQAARPTKAEQEEADMESFGLSVGFLSLSHTVLCWFILCALL
jgi:hypothetical protein